MNQFGAQASDHFVKRERAGFFRHDAMENNLQQHVTQLLAEMTHVFSQDCFVRLKGFFNQIIGNAVVSLLGVPRTASWCSELAHYRDQAFEFVHWGIP